jgi:hypothetical protein
MKRKNARYLALAVALVSLIVFGIANTASGGNGGNGNGAPSGPHFNLNIHGVANGQGFNGSNKNDIFVPLGSNGNIARCHIDLTMGDFGVTDPNCTDDGVAGFSLPNPCPDACANGDFAYSVWARALTPGGSANMYSCYTDTTTGDTYCDTGLLVVSLNKVTPPKFTNVSQQLLSVCDATTGKSIPLFSNSNYDYFWNYDNQGLRLAQLRFYQVPEPFDSTSTCTAVPQ